MAVFAYQYYNSYAATVDSMSVGAVMSAVLQLDTRQQLALFQKLGNLLAAINGVPDHELHRRQGFDPGPAGVPADYPGS